VGEEQQHARRHLAVEQKVAMREEDLCDPHDRLEEALEPLPQIRRSDD
jgi:hypothetical protein